MCKRSAVISALLACCIVFVFSANAARSASDFTFKTIKPPKPGATKRINIQIQPGTANDTVKTVTVSSPPAQTSDWFWNAVSADLSAAAPGRFPDALKKVAMLAPKDALDIPGFDRFHAASQKFGTEILLATLGRKVSPALVLAVIGVESGGDPNAVSKKGAEGLMQLSPATAANFNVKDPLDPAENIRGGVEYLDKLLTKYNRDPILALAAYNAGETAIATYKGVPPFAETRAYVPKVLAAYQTASALCMTPPELFSDGCVFAPRETN